MGKQRTQSKTSLVQKVMKKKELADSLRPLNIICPKFNLVLSVLKSLHEVSIHTFSPFKLDDIYFGRHFPFMTKTFI